MRTLDIRPHGAVKHHQATERSGSARAFDKTMGKISDRTKVIAVKVTGSDVKVRSPGIALLPWHACVRCRRNHFPAEWWQLVNICLVMEAALYIHGKRYSV